MTVYADASLLVALLIRDAFNERARRFLGGRPTTLLISDFAAAEFGAVVGRRVRVGELTTSEALAAFASLDEWVAAHGPRVELVAADVVIAETFLRRLDLGLRAPDAIHLAIARRQGAALATFDERMAVSAAALGLELAPA